jgi:formate/nitrite transporter FocA (FNT family)
MVLSDRRYEIPITAPIKTRATAALFAAFLSVTVFANSKTKAAAMDKMNNIYAQYKFALTHVSIAGSDTFSLRLDKSETTRNTVMPRNTHNIIVVILANFIGSFIF